MPEPSLSVAAHRGGWPHPEDRELRREHAVPADQGHHLEQSPFGGRRGGSYIAVVAERAGGEDLPGGGVGGPFGVVGQRGLLPPVQVTGRGATTPMSVRTSITAGRPDSIARSSAAGKSAGLSTAMPSAPISSAMRENLTSW